MDSPNLRILERSAFYTGFSFFFLDFYIQILGVALKASAFEIGLFTGAVFIAQVISHPIAGVLADKIGRSRTLAIGGFGRVISLLLVGIAFGTSSANLITIGRLFQGLAAGFFWTSSSALVADETEGGGRSGEFGRVNLWVNRGMLVGALGGLVLLPVRLDAPPYFFALAAVASGIYALKIKPSTLAGLQPLVDGPRADAEAGTLVATGLAVLNFLNSAGTLMFSSFLTVFVAETVFPSSFPFENGAVMIALANSPQVLLLAFVSPKIARIGDKMGRVRPLLLSMLAMLPISYGLIWIRQLWHLALLGILIAFVGVVFGTSFNAIIGDVYRSRRGFVYGGLNMSFSLGAALGSFLGGYLYPMGWDKLILTSIGIQLSAFAGLALITRGYMEIRNPFIGTRAPQA